MKNAILLHGYNDSPDSFWLPWLKKQLEAKGFDVWVPQLPEKETPSLKVQLPFVLENTSFTEETVIVGHSCGCPLTLAILESIDVKIKQAILVGGFCEAEGVLEFVKPIVRDQYDWQAIASHVDEFIAINSDNDPWTCDDKQGRIMVDNIGGMQIIRKGDGHMGSNEHNQPYDEFPLLMKLIG